MGHIGEIQPPIQAESHFVRIELIPEQKGDQYLGMQRKTQSCAKQDRCQNKGKLFWSHN